MCLSMRVSHVLSDMRPSWCYHDGLFTEFLRHDGLMEHGITVGMWPLRRACSREIILLHARGRKETRPHV